MNTDDKSTILEFLGWKLVACECGVEGCVGWRGPNGATNPKLDDNLIAQALAKLSGRQRREYILEIQKQYDKSDTPRGIDYWYIFDCPLSTKAEVLAGVIRGK